MKWNTDGLQFLYQPDVFTGTFDNEKMQQRHEEALQQKLTSLKACIDSSACPMQALKLLNVKDHMTFFTKNEQGFREAEKFEEAVLLLYSRLNAPFSSGGNHLEWNQLFNKCDRMRLAELGSPIPFAKTTLYRGSVSGCMRSLSWTPDRQQARKYGERWQDPQLGGGKIYELEAEAAEVLVYLKRSREEEVILSPDFVERADIRICSF